MKAFDTVINGLLAAPPSINIPFASLDSEAFYLLHPVAIRAIWLREDISELPSLKCARALLEDRHHPFSMAYQTIAETNDRQHLFSVHILQNLDERHCFANFEKLLNNPIMSDALLNHLLPLASWDLSTPITEYL